MDQMPKKSAFALIVLVVLLAMATACGSAANTASQSAKPAAESPKSDGKTITLKIGNIYPVKHVVHEKGYLVLQKLIEEKSKGQIKVQLYPTEQLGSAFDMVDLVKNGVADVGSVVPSYWPDKFPVSQAYGLPAIYADNWVGTQAMWRSLHEGPIHDELLKAGLVPIMLESAPIPEWFTKSKKIDKIDNMNGLKMRSTGGVMDLSLKSVGAIPVQLPLTQIYENLDRGTIDGVAMNYSLASGFNVQEVAKYVTDGAGVFPIGISIAAISATKFNSLPDDLKQVLYEAGKEATVGLAGSFMADNDAKKEKMRTSGINIVKLPQEFLTQMKGKMQPAYDNYTKVLDSRGLNGKSVLDSIIKDIEESKKAADPKVLPDYKNIGK